MDLKFIIPLFIVGLVFFSGCTSTLMAKSVETDLPCEPGDESSDDANAYDIACRIKCEAKNWEYTGDWKCPIDTGKIVCYCKER